jgi:hypothetical protein
MADLKISQLTASTTPLTGTEVLPIVQSGTTKQVSVGNLTAGRTVSGTTFRSGDGLQSAPAYSFTSSVDSGMFFGAGYTQISTENALYALFGSANIYLQYPTSITGNTTLSTGNLVIGTSGKGIDFSATPGTGTSELLNDYEEGTWTPTDTSGAGLTFTPAQCIYTKVGRLVTVSGVITFPVTLSTAAVSIGGLPFTQSASNTATAALGTNSGVSAVAVIGGSTILVRSVNNGDFLNVNFSGLFLFFSTTYTV